jgi:hypothetical protein
MHFLESRGHLKLHGESNATDVVVASPEPLFGEVLGFLDGFDDVFAEPFMSDDAVVTLDVGVLLGLSELDRC